MTEQIIPIYSGSLEDFHWVGFGSGSGTNLRECAKVIKPSLIFSDRLKTHPKATLFQQPQLLEKRGIIHESINGYKACGSWKKVKGIPQLEAEYEEKSLEFNQAIVDLLHKYEERLEYPFDLIVLGGYMRLIKAPLLEAYRDRMINVHPADLSIIKQHEEYFDDGFLNTEYVEGLSKYYRIFVGEDAVYDAIRAGETSTKSSVIMVDGGIDHGEILTQGPELRVWEEFLEGTGPEREECFREYADGHQSMQKVRSDWPALTNALEMIAQGRIALGTEKSVLSEWRRVYLDDKKLDYCGFQVASGGK